MGRKNLLTDLIDAKLTAVNSLSTAAELNSAQPTLGPRGAVGAMSRSLELLSAEREAGKVLGELLAAGHTIVEIDPRLIDSSIVPDRMKGADREFSALVESIRERGQLVPVLLRPHPTAQGRFQIAYGHRRVRAAAELGMSARAVVRQLTDEDLVVAQGKENNERKDLSFIERAKYAMALENHGFGREVIIAALGVDKTELSRLITVAHAVPSTLIDAIGPAPKTGRRRWMTLVEHLARDRNEKALAEALHREQFASADSDDRFALVLGALRMRAEASPSVIWAADDGRRVARIQRSPDRVTLALDEKAAPAFGEFVVSRLPDLYQAFLERGTVDAATPNKPNAAPTDALSGD